MHDDASITPSIVIHSHLLDGIVTSVCDLPPFLPASDPRLPNARLGMVLLLHHLESKTFTYRDTQLSRFDDLAAHPLYFTVQFRANGSHTKRAPDAGDSGAIPSLFLRLSILPVGRRSAARTSAGNASRSAVLGTTRKNQNTNFVRLKEID